MHGTTLMAWCAIWLGAGALTGPTQSDLQKWFEAQLDRDVDSFVGDRVLRVRYTVTNHSGLSPAEAERLRERIGSRPDHPDQRQLAAHDASGRPTTCEVLLTGGGDWYQERDAGGRITRYVKRDHAYWMHAVGRQLTITGDEEFPVIYDIGTSLSDIHRVCGYVVSGGLGGVDLRPASSPSLDGIKWNGRARSPLNVAVTASGEWRERIRAFVTTEVSAAPPQMKGVSIPPERFTLEEYRQSDVLPYPIPGRVRRFRGDGLVEEIEIDEVAWDTRDSLRELTRIPDADTESQTFDFRDPQSEAWAFYSDVPRVKRERSGEFRVIEPGPGPKPGHPAGVREKTNAFWALGLALGGVVVIVGFWVVRRIRQ